MSATTMSSSSMRSGASTELCAATPVLNHNRDSSTASSEDQRSRSNKGSSNDDEPQGSDGFVNEDWRAGGPYLCTIPTLTCKIPRDHPLYDRLVMDSIPLYLEIAPILESAGVNERSMGFLRRQSLFEPEAQPIVTLSIDATKRDTEEDWLSVSRSVCEFLDSQGLPDVSVEICDARAVLPDLYHLIVPEDAIFPIWDRVLETMLENCDLTDWNSVGCYRIGKEEDWKKNPPTVIVTVNNSLPDWRPTRETIVAILDSFHLPMVGVKIKRDNIIFGCSSRPNISSTSLKDMVQVGHSIGRRGYRGESGTFGGWVELLNSATGQWHTFGLTCAHSVLPSDVPGMFKLSYGSIYGNANIV